MIDITTALFLIGIFGITAGICLISILETEPGPVWLGVKTAAKRWVRVPIVVLLAVVYPVPAVYVMWKCWRDPQTNEWSQLLKAAAMLGGGLVLWLGLSWVAVLLLAGVING